MRFEKLPDDSHNTRHALSSGSPWSARSKRGMSRARACALLLTAPPHEPAQTFLEVLLIGAALRPRRLSQRGARMQRAQATARPRTLGDRRRQTTRDPRVAPRHANLKSRRQGRAPRALSLLLLRGRRARRPEAQTSDAASTDDARCEGGSESAKAMHATHAKHTEPAAVLRMHDSSGGGRAFRGCALLAVLGGNRARECRSYAGGQNPCAAPKRTPNGFAWPRRIRRESSAC